MPVPPPNQVTGPDGLSLVRFYVPEDPVYADVDNRPLSDLAERDRQLDLKIGQSEGQVDNLAAKIGEDPNTPHNPAGGPPTYPLPLYAIESGNSHHVALKSIDTELERLKQFVGKDALSQVLPVFSTKGSPQFAIVDGDALASAVAKLDAAAQNLNNALLNLPHNNTQSIQGGDASNRWHAALNQIQAQAAYGGYTPGAGNPFATVGWVNSVSNLKACSGVVSLNNPGAGVYTDVWINLATGAITGSYVAGYGYYGDVGFSTLKCWLLANSSGSSQDDDEHHGWSMYVVSATATQIHFRAMAYQMSMPYPTFIAIGA